MADHVTHYYVDSGWPDEYHAGCHIEVYEKHSSSLEKVTCKHCLRNERKWREAARAARQQQEGGESHG